METKKWRLLSAMFPCNFMRRCCLPSTLIHAHPLDILCHYNSIQQRAPLFLFSSLAIYESFLSIVLSIDFFFLFSPHVSPAPTGIHQTSYLLTIVLSYVLAAGFVNTLYQCVSALQSKGSSLTMLNARFTPL